MRETMVTGVRDNQQPDDLEAGEGAYMIPVLFWLCRVEIITEHGQDVQTFTDDQQGQIIIITVVVEGATGQHLRSKCQLAFHSRIFRVRDSKCDRKRE